MVPEGIHIVPAAVLLRCDDAHPVTCGVVFHGAVPAVLSDACEHGTRVHGFTPAYYTAERRTKMAAAAQR
jgi:hypothetical protein